MKNNPKVIFVGDSRKMKGGVSTVIKTIEKSFIWNKYNCYWLQCQINSNIIVKLLYLFRSYFISLFKIPAYNVVFFNTAVGNSMLVQLPILLYSILCGKKIIVELHVGNQITDYLNDSIFKFWVNHSDLVLTLGKKWAEVLTSQGWVRTNVSYSYNPAPEVEIPQAPLNYFLFAAYLDKNKGYESLLEAFCKVLQKYPDWNLYVCGTGDVRDVEKLVSSLDIKDKVVLTGWVEGDKKIDLFKRAYAYCMTSEKEGLPMSVLEAMSYGIPVISTYTGCLPEFLENGKSALMYAYGDVDALADNMMRLIENRELRDSMSSESQNVIRGTFMRESVLARLDNLIQTVINNA